MFQSKHLRHVPQTTLKKQKANPKLFFFFSSFVSKPSKTHRNDCCFCCFCCAQQEEVQGGHLRMDGRQATANIVLPSLMWHTFHTCWPPRCLHRVGSSSPSFLLISCFQQAAIWPPSLHGVVYVNCLCIFSMAGRLGVEGTQEEDVQNIHIVKLQ